MSLQSLPMHPTTLPMYPLDMEGALHAARISLPPDKVNYLRFESNTPSEEISPFREEIIEVSHGDVRSFALLQVSTSANTEHTRDFEGILRGNFEIQRMVPNLLLFLTISSSASHDLKNCHHVIHDAVFPASTTAPVSDAGPFDQVVSLARRHGLNTIADRLVELNDLSDEDAEPIQPDAARSFVTYCISRGNRGGRPLISATPSGEVDATWRSGDGERVTMRFFKNDLVWIAYKLKDSQGSVETFARNLSNSDFSFKTPQWA